MCARTVDKVLFSEPFAWVRARLLVARGGMHSVVIDILIIALVLGVISFTIDRKIQLLKPTRTWVLRCPHLDHSESSPGVSHWMIMLNAHIAVNVTADALA